MFLIVRVTGAALPTGKIWVLGVMVMVGAVVYAAELLITKDPMVKMGIELIKKKA